MVISKTSKSAGKTTVLTKKRDQTFDIVAAIQSGRHREALTQLKDLLDPANDPETQKYMTKCSSGAAGSEGQGPLAHKSLQNYWRLPFRGLSHQVYAILREEFALTGSFDSVLRRLDVSLSEHPKQARKLAEERKVLRSKGANDMRAWTKSSDELLQQSFAKRTNVATRDERQSFEMISETVALPAFATLQDDADGLGFSDVDSGCRHNLITKGTDDKDVPLSGTGIHESSNDTPGSQDTMYLQDILGDDSVEQLLHRNKNRLNPALMSLDYPQPHIDAFRRSVLNAWRHGAGRKKSWNFRPPQKLPTRRKHNGFCAPAPGIEESFCTDPVSDTGEPSLSESSSGPGMSFNPGPIPGATRFRCARVVKKPRKYRVQSKRWRRQAHSWKEGRNLWRLENPEDVDNFRPTWTCPRLHWYPKERKSTKVVIQRAKRDKDQEKPCALQISWALTKPVIVESRLLSSTTQDTPRPHPMIEGTFSEEKLIFESLLSNIPESLPGSSVKRQKRRGINKLKIPEFNNAEHLLSFLQAGWQNLLGRMTEMKDTLPQGWAGTQESYSRKRRTFQAWEKQLEDLEPTYVLARKLEIRHCRADTLIRKEIKRLEMYITWVEHSQSALVDLPWTMRKQPGADLIMTSPLLDLTDYSELIRHGIINYTDDFAFDSTHWDIHGINVSNRVTKAYREWCQMSENLIKPLLNSRISVAA